MSLRRLLVAGCAAALLLGAAAPAHAVPEWQAVPMPIPPGGQFRTPVGLPGDISFWAPNRGLMTVAGNTSVPEGIYSWDGVDWHQLSTVCGGGNNARIAWAGPTEFWVISRPSLPRAQQPGLALCHFKDGQVIGSFSVPEASADPYHELMAAACRSADDCWFGGVAGRDGTGQRVGAFHLHWNGSELRTVYGPQGRAISDLISHGGELFESTLVGRAPGNKENPELVEAEDPPRLLHRITGESFENDPFVPQAVSGVPDEATELRALDSDGQTAWAVGGGAVSGPALGAGGVYFPRPPVAARLTAGTWTQLAVTGLTSDLAFSDVAAIPGTQTAWAVVREGSVIDEGDDLHPSVARIGAGGAAQLVALGANPDPWKGAAWRIECPAVDDCWMVTARGYLYRWFDPAAPPAYPRDTDAAFQGTITVRPNEAAEQSIPDAPPEDDSQPPPPVELETEEEEDLPPCTPLRPLVYKVQAKARGRTRLVVSFRLRRAVRVQLVARRGQKMVAKTKLRRMRAGKRSLTLHVRPQTWPNRLRFVIKGDNRKRKPCQGGGNNDNTVTTGPAAASPMADPW